MHDIVIRNGTIVDGTGEERFVGDVALDGDKIAAVGTVTGRGRQEIDATDKLVTPGFVDVHTHYDGQVTWDPQMTPSSWHGCTSVVMGNCGVGFAPVKPSEREWVIGLMEGVEDIPGAALAEGIAWNWETFPQFLDALDGMHRAIDFGTQIAHGPLRAYVMGHRGAANEAATGEDIAAMAQHVRDALSAGALGFSTSRTLLHKSIEGVPVPGTFAAKDELYGIGQALADVGAGVFQLAAEHTQVPQELPWMRQLARNIGRPVIFNLSQTDFASNLWRDVLGQLETIADEDAGLQGAGGVFAQVAGRAIGIVMHRDLTAHPFAAHPDFLALGDVSSGQRLAAMRDPSFRERLLNNPPTGLGPFETFVTRAFHKMFLCDAGIDYEPTRGASVAAIAKATGRRPEEVAYDALLDDDGAGGMIYFPLFNYSDGDLDVLHRLHSHPRTMMGLSDAGAHCGAVCDGGMPTFMLTHWTRDRDRGDRLPLEYVVRRQTAATAAMFGLGDRGLLTPGYKGDVNVIDYNALAFERPRIVHDLPAGGRRLVQRARGYEATICSGTTIIRHDEPTGALPGRLIRGSRSARG